MSTNEETPMNESIQLNGELVMRGNGHLAMIYFNLTGRNFDGDQAAYKRYLDMMKKQLQVSEWRGELTFESPTQTYSHSFNH